MTRSQASQTDEERAVAVKNSATNPSILFSSLSYVCLLLTSWLKTISRKKISNLYMRNIEDVNCDWTEGPPVEVTSMAVNCGINIMPTGEHLGFLQCEIGQGANMRAVIIDDRLDAL